MHALSARRPALWAALLWSGGVLLGRISTPPVLLLLSLCAALFLFALALFLVGRRVHLPLSLLVIALGFLRYEMDTALLPADHIARVGPFGEECIVRGQVGEEPERREGEVRLVLEVQEVETPEVWRRVSGRALVTLRGVGDRVEYGDRLAVRARLRRPSPARNPGGFDYGDFLRRQGIDALLSIGKKEQVLAVERGEGNGLWERVVLPVRRSVRESVRRNLEGAPAGLLEGLLLGEKQRVPEKVRDAFRRAGLAHALVVSGLHVGLVALFFLTVFRLCRLGEEVASGATVGALFAYALVTELQAPVLRAALMGGVVLAGRALGRPGEIYNSLGLAALLILGCWPQSLFGLSFQLSFGATLAIVGLHGSVARLFPQRWRGQEVWAGKWVVAPLCVSLAAQLGTGPLIAQHFQQLSLVGPLANLVVVPLLGAAVGLGLLAALTGWCLPLLSTLFNAANYPVLKGLEYLADFFGALPWAAVEVEPPGALFMAWAAGMLFLLGRWQGRMRGAALLLVLAGLNAWVWGYAGRERGLEVVFLDVGQGDAAFVRWPGGRTMVVDGGPRDERFDAGARVLVPFLRQRGIGTVDVVVASHPHGDHIGGLLTLLEEMEVGHYVDGGQIHDSWMARRLRQVVVEKGIAYHRVAAGDSLVGLGGAGALVLHPRPGFVDGAGESPLGLNNGSVVLRLSYGRVSVLLTGDVEREAEPAVLSWGERVRAQVVKVGHHGSRTSSTELFVEGAGAAVAVVSAGAFNKFRHPAAEVVERWASSGAQVLRTDRRGAVHVRSNGEAVVVRTLLPQEQSGVQGEALSGPQSSLQRTLRRKLSRSILPWL